MSDTRKENVVDETNIKHGDSMISWIEFGELAPKLISESLKSFDYLVPKLKGSKINELLIKKAREGYIPDPDALITSNSEFRVLSALIHREVARLTSALALKSNKFLEQALSAYLSSISLLMIELIKNPYKRIKEEIDRTLFEMNFIVESRGGNKEKTFMETLELIVESILKYLDIK